jgi:hypothetical protein
MDEAGCLRYLEVLATTDIPHWAHHSTFIVAEVDGRPAAALCGYFDEEHGMQALQKAASEADERLGRTAEETAGVEADRANLPRDAEPRPGRMDRRERRNPPGSPPARARYDRAQHAYEKAGFRVTGEKRHPDFESVWGCPGISALSRDL